MSSHRLGFGFMTLPRSLDETRLIAQAADSGGWDWMGIADSPVVYEESYVHQALALTVTERIRVGPLVSHVVIRHPLVVGNLLATLSELGGGRTVGVLATGNSAARGLGLPPASFDDLREAVLAIRSFWAGESAAYRESRIPASGRRRHGGSLMIAGDGPKAATLAGQIADGMLYGGTLDDAVVRRRVSAGKRRSDQTFWIAPAVSLADSREGVIEDMGAMLVAQANRALRGDLTERGVPGHLHSEIKEIWRSYNYAFHADNTRPRNTSLMSEELAAFLVDRFVLWGDGDEWRAAFSKMRDHGCDGVMFILGQGDQGETVRDLTGWLSELGELNGRSYLRARGRAI